MPLAHVCPGCGTDLSRRRAPPEPIYGFRLVRCPGCGRHAVRRPPPLRRALHAFLRLDAALTALALQIFMLMLAIIAVSTYGIAGGDLAARGHGLAELDRSDLAFVALTTVLVGAGVGAWLTAGFAHLRRRGEVVAAFVAIVIAIAALEPLVLRPLDGRAADPTVAARRVAALVPVLLALPLGWPIGRLLLVGARRFRSWRFGWRRRRRRRSFANG